MQNAQKENKRFVQDDKYKQMFYKTLDKYVNKY